MHATVITPERVAFEADDVEHVQVPASNGDLGILPGHVAMVCTINVGRLRVDRPGRSVHLAVSWGFAEVLNDRITITVATAELAEEIDMDRARRARDRAQAVLDGEHGSTTKAAAQTAIERALNRLAVGGGH